jgi:hypothetical protein
MSNLNLLIFKNIYSHFFDLVMFKQLPVGPDPDTNPETGYGVNSSGSEALITVTGRE